MPPSITQIDRQIEPFRPLRTRRLVDLVATTGKCSGTDDTERFFPLEPANFYPDRRGKYEQNARKQCGGCHARLACLLLALRTEAQPRQVPYGIYGGMAPWERKAMLRRLRRRGVQLDTSQTVSKTRAVAS